MKEFLSQRGVDFEERDVSRDRVAAQEMVNRTGQMGVPVIDIDGQLIIGFDRARLEQELGQQRQSRQSSPSLGAAVADSRGRPGAYVGKVRPGSAAERLGLQPGDIIVRVNRQPVTSADDLGAVIRNLGPGSHVLVTVVRGNAELAAEGIL